MQLRAMRWGIVAAALVVVLPGCRHACKRNGSCLPPNDATLTPRGRLLEPPVEERIAPPAVGLPSVSEPRYLPAEASSEPMPTPSAAPPTNLPPASIPATPRERRFRPNSLNESARVLDVPSESARLLDDPIIRTPAARSNQSDTSTEPPTTIPAEPMTTSVPAARKVSFAGVPGYSVVQPGVATGRKPNVDGFDALRAAGYQTVVYLHPAGHNVTTTRELAEKKGFVFVSLPVSPASFRPGFAQFADLVGVRTNRPVFLFDDDGLRTGAVWYTYFRAIEALGDDAAQVKAAPLGLRDSTGEEKSKFWIAIQEYLAKR